MKIIDFPKDDKDIIQQVAALLVEGFGEHWPEAWPDMTSAIEEVEEGLEADRINRLAVDEAGVVLGWIGAIDTYDGRGWELHPLVVDPHLQGQGIGRALVEDLEERVRERGGITIYLGSDDVDGMTSLSGVDLYTNLFQYLADIKNIKGHPYEFYQKLGYTVVGVIPDANGFGKPDIMMAKRIRHPIA